MNYIDKIVWNRVKTDRGRVIRVSERYCAVCGRSTCLIVRWSSDHRITKPCLHGIKYLPNGDLQIM